MQSLLNEPQSDDRSRRNETEAEAWQQIAPLLETAMDSLGEKDRDAVVLRYLDGKSLSEVGAALGASEDAAKMRVNRALEKLRKIFSKRGVPLTATLIGGAVAANSVQAAPVGFAATVATAAAKGAGISAAIATLVKGTMKTMMWLKLQFAVGVAVVALLAGGAATVALTDQRQMVGFEVAGIFSRVTPSGESSFWGAFSAVVSGEKSIISFRYFNGESVVCGTDGSDSYRLNEMLSARLKNPSNLQFGTISEGPFPKKALAPEQLIWLAYASSPFRSESDFRLPMESFREIGSYVTSTTTSLREAPHLPNRIQWWAPNFTVVGMTNRSYLVAYPEGHLAAEFEVTSQTNFMGMTLPLHYAYSMFAPKSHDSASSLELARFLQRTSAKTLQRDDVLPIETLVCTVTNLTSINYKGDFLPTLGTNVSIDDWRFERELGHGINGPIQKFVIRGGVLVNITPTNSWPRRSDPELIERVRAEKQAQTGLGPVR